MNETVPMNKKQFSMFKGKDSNRSKGSRNKKVGKNKKLSNSAKVLNEAENSSFNMKDKFN